MKLTIEISIDHRSRLKYLNSCALDDILQPTLVGLFVYASN